MSYSGYEHTTFKFVGQSTTDFAMQDQGRPQDLGGGGQEFYFSDLGICMSRSDMLRMAKPCALLGGFVGMPPEKIF